MSQKSNDSNHSNHNNGIESYFESYENLEVHQLMLSDKPRLKSYKDALFNMKEQLNDKIIMDVGAGTGILSIFCAQLGARKIYAVEASNLADIATKVIKDNNFEDKIKVLRNEVEKLEISKIEKVDIIISEWMGFYLIHEGMLDSVIFARDNFLKENGMLFPNIAKIYAAPCQLPEFYESWNDIFGVDMKYFGELLRKSKSSKPVIQMIQENQLLSDPKLLFWYDLNCISSEDLDTLSTEQKVIVCNKDGNLQGLCIWFEVEFPDESNLSTAPSAAPTHWKQTLIILPNSVPVSTLEPIAFELRFERTLSDLRKYNITLEMLDALNIDHDLPCECYMTKCIVSKAYIEKQN